MSRIPQNQHQEEAFPRKAFETVCFHTIGLIDQNREYLQMHLAGADENTRQALADVELETARLERVVGEMMDLLAAEQEPPPLRCLDLCEVLRQVEELEADVFRQLGVRLTVTSAEDHCFVQGDPEQTGQLCFHLVSNALRAAEAGGTVEVALQKTETGWELTVRDDGCGLPDPEKGNWKENRRRFLGGAGAGLRLCRAVCARAGWTLTVEARSGKGTQARVELPALPENALPSVELSAAGAEKISHLGWMLSREMAILKKTRTE